MDTCFRRRVLIHKRDVRNMHYDMLVCLVMRWLTINILEFSNGVCSIMQHIKTLDLEIGFVITASWIVSVIQNLRQVYMLHNRMKNLSWQLVLRWILVITMLVIYRISTHLQMRMKYVYTKMISLYLHFLILHILV